MKAGCAAPHNEDSEARDKLINDGWLSVNKYERAVTEGDTTLGD